MFSFSNLLIKATFTALLLLLSSETTVFSVQDLPLIISRQSDNVKQAWHDVSVLILENEKLSKPLADPYITRAEIWSLVGNEREALEDYIHATEIIMSGNPNLYEQSRILEQLSASLNRLNSQPSELFPMEASEAYRNGIRLFIEAKFTEAAPYFAEATRLFPEEPVYRVMRALNEYKLNKHSSALKHIAVTAAILRFPENNEFKLRGFHKGLEMIQGSDRRWISEQLSKIRYVKQ